MKLFFTVFAAILAAAAVILTCIYPKARLDDWEKAKWMIIAEMQNNNVASQAVSDRYMAEARQRAVLAHDYNDVAIVNQLTGAAVSESQESLKRLRQIQTRAVVLLENKPFGIPLTADEQTGLTSLKAEIAKSANPAPMPTPDQAAQETYPQDESMKPSNEASEAERQRRRQLHQREAQETYPQAKAVVPEEMVASRTPTTILSGDAAKALAVYAPPPEYPYEARSRHITGSGVVVMNVDISSGLVTSASMAQSIGSPILDNGAMSAFRRWRFKPGTVAKVRMPISFTVTGAKY